MKRITFCLLVLLFLLSHNSSSDCVPALSGLDLPYASGSFTLPKKYKPDIITIEEALVIIHEARDSHILFKWFLENGFASPTEWTGDIAFQNYIIARYTKVIELLESLKRSKPIPDIKHWRISNEKEAGFFIR